MMTVSVSQRYHLIYTRDDNKTVIATIESQILTLWTKNIIATTISIDHPQSSNSMKEERFCEITSSLTNELSHV